MKNRKTAVNFHSFTVMPNKDQKKEFSTMFEILKDAEKYDEAGEKEVCKSMLETLKNYIDSYDSEDEDETTYHISLKRGDIKLSKPEFPKDRPNTTSTNNI